MAAPIGYSFAPTFDNAELGKRGGSPVTQNQDAIKTLNFQLKPQVVGASGGISPLAGSSPRGSNFGGAVLASVMRAVLGADQASAFMDGIGGDDRRTSRDPGSAILGQIAGASGGVGDQGIDLNQSSLNPVIRPGGDRPGGAPDFGDAPGGVNAGTVPDVKTPWTAPERNPHWADKYEY